MTNSDSQKLNTLKRAIDIQEAYEAYQQDYEDKTGFRLTKKQVWSKHFKGKPYRMSYYTFLSYVNKENPQDQIDELTTTIIQQKEATMKQPSLFSAIAILFALMQITSCKLFQPAQPSAADCAALYPCRDSIAIFERTVTDTVEVTDTYIDTVTVTDCPPNLPDTLRITDTIRIRIPGKKIPIEVIVMDTTAYRIDSALVRAFAGCKEKNTALEAQITALGQQPTDGSYPWWWLLITAIGGFFVRNFFSKKQ